MLIIVLYFTSMNLQQIIKDEEDRQRSTIDLIPSENYVSKDVQTALGSVFTNKYSEGYPGKRYYGGQKNMDLVEQEAIDLAKKLFRADHANVQPLSGAPANLAVYAAWLEPGDTVLAMDLSHGGHLTHGHPVTLPAKLYNFIRYGIGDMETGELDYDNLAEMIKEHKPKIILMGYSSYPREPDYEKVVEIAKGSGALLMADVAHVAGLIAGGVHKNPLDFGFHVLTTTTHKTLRGPRGGMILTKGTVSNPLKKVEKTIDNIPTLIDRQVFPGLQGGPHMNNILAKMVAFEEASSPEFATYAQIILDNAKVLSDELMRLGCKLITNGTSNHMMVVNVKESFDIDGKEAEERLEKEGIIVNKNVIPDDPLPPFSPSGIRMGTPAVTTRGMSIDDMKELAKKIVNILSK